MKVRKSVVTAMMLMMSLTMMTFGQLPVRSEVDGRAVKGNGRNVPGIAETKISFNSPIGTDEVVELVYMYGLEPRELNFEIENPYGETIYGGYSIDPGVQLQSAIADMKAKHETFLKEAISTLSADASKEADAGVRNGLKALNRQFRELLAENGRSGLKLTSISVKDDQLMHYFVIDERIGRVEKIYRNPRGDKFDTELLIDSNDEAAKDVVSTSATSYSWAPYKGSSKVNRSLAFQVFYFRDVSAFGSTSTYEHETQVYEPKFAKYGGYYSTNLPSGYKDTTFGDTIDNFTVGTPYGSQLKANTQYYTSMALLPETASSALVRTKGQKGYRSPSYCSSTWCIWPSATTGTLVSFTAPISTQKSW